MYYAHFGLKEPPFKITPNTEFFFNGSNRGAVLDALIYAVTNGEGIIKVVGEVGSGKTMLCRMLQSSLPESVECIYLANPSVAPEDILHAIAFELGLKLPKNADKLKVMQTLQSYLLHRHEAGKRVVIFIEEAQGMPLATLEEIRLLSNLETKHEKLLQMVLFGQPELDENLNQTQIRQLRERITHSFYLSPLRTKEVADYLIFRLRAAGYFGPHLFSDKAIAKMSKASEGLVRRVNILADKALLAAFADNVYLVTPKHVQAAIVDSEFGAEKARNANKRWLLLGGSGVVLAGILLGYAVHVYQSGSLAHWLNSWRQAEKNAPAKAVKFASAEKSPTQVNLTAMPTHAEDVPTSPGSEAATTQPTATEPISGSAAWPSSAASNPETLPVTPTLAMQAQVPTEVSRITDVPSSDVLQSRLTVSQQWLASSHHDTVTIQILGTSDREQLIAQLTRLIQLVELDNLYVYETLVNQRPFYTVLFGSFVSRRDANLALKQLPADLQKNRPHLRTVGGILAETNKIS